MRVRVRRPWFYRVFFFFFVSIVDLDYGTGGSACLLMTHDSAEERQRLAEAVKHHSVNHSSVPDQPEGEGLASWVHQRTE